MVFLGPGRYHHPSRAARLGTPVRSSVLMLSALPVSNQTAPLLQVLKDSYLKLYSALLTNLHLTSRVSPETAVGIYRWTQKNFNISAAF